MAISHFMDNDDQVVFNPFKFTKPKWFFSRRNARITSADMEMWIWNWWLESLEMVAHGKIQCCKLFLKPNRHLRR